MLWNILILFTVLNCRGSFAEIKTFKELVTAVKSKQSAMVSNVTSYYDLNYNQGTSSYYIDNGLSDQFSKSNSGNQIRYSENGGDYNILYYNTYKSFTYGEAEIIAGQPFIVLIWLPNNEGKISKFKLQTFGYLTYSRSYGSYSSEVIKDEDLTCEYFVFNLYGNYYTYTPVHYKCYNKRWLSAEGATKVSGLGTLQYYTQWMTYSNMEHILVGYTLLMKKSYSSTPESEIKAVMLELMKALKTFDPYNYDTLNIQNESNGKKKTLLSHEVLLFFIASTIYSLF